MHEYSSDPINYIHRHRNSSKTIFFNNITHLLNSDFFVLHYLLSLIIANDYMIIFLKSIINVNSFPLYH